LGKYLYSALDVIFYKNGAIQIIQILLFKLNNNDLTTKAHGKIFISVKNKARFNFLSSIFSRLFEIKNILE